MPRTLSKDRGAINFVQVFLVLLLIGGGYLAWVYGPLWIQYFGMRKAVRVACNAAYRDRSEDGVRDVIMREWKELNVQDGSLEDGTIKMVATPFDRTQNIDITFAKDPASVTVGIHYTQHIVFPFVNKERDIDFEYTHNEDLAPIKY
jgi:hypothetical protein